jgi:flagellar biosynthesis GTPase FlhF
MSAVETRTFRADSLEEALGAVRRQLGPDAIVLRQREGIVGGIGGFFGKRCVEIDVECPPEEAVLQAAPRRSAMPARAVTNAYTGGDGVAVDAHVEDQGDLFQSLLDESSVFASTLVDAIERRPDPEPAIPEPVKFEFEPIAAEPVVAETVAPEPVVVAPQPPIEQLPVELPRVEQPLPAELVPLDLSDVPLTVTLARAGIDPRLAESLVADADSQLRVFDPDEPFVNQVREMLASKIPTRRPSGKFKRRVIALVGPPGSGKTSAVARLCEAHAAAGRRVVALSLEPVRATLELGKQTEHLDVELISADHPGLIDFALGRIARAETVVVDTPGVGSRDEDGWARLAMLLRPLAAHETHLVLPGWLYPAGVDDFIGSASQKLQIDRLLLTHLETGPGPGPAVSAAVRAGIPISATSTGERLVPADPYRLAKRILP